MESSFSRPTMPTVSTRPPQRPPLPPVLKRRGRSSVALGPPPIGPGRPPAHRFRLPAPRSCPLIGHGPPTKKEAGVLGWLSAHAATLKAIHKTKALALSGAYKFCFEGFVFAWVFGVFFFSLTKEGLNWVGCSFQFVDCAQPIRINWACNI